MYKQAFLSIFICQSILCQAQILSFPTPYLQSLETKSDNLKYSPIVNGDIPVSPYTGKALISVPIQSFTENGVTLDINLTYDTSGCHMNKFPGWVGQDWNINVGGVITRTQNGFCDEMDFSIEVKNQRNWDNFMNYFHAHVGLSEDSVTYHRNELIQHSLMRDYSPDMFSFNFMGKTGCFFMGSDGEWKVISDDNIVVLLDVTEPQNYTSPYFKYFPIYGGHSYLEPKALRGFVLLDDEGNKYTFGFTDESIAYSLDFFKATDRECIEPWIATSWYLTKVEDRFGNQLFGLSYTRGKFTAQLYRTDNTTSILGINGSMTNTDNYSGTLNIPSYISSITTRGGSSVEFLFLNPYLHGMASECLYPNLQAQTLNSIELNHTNYKYYYLQSNDPLARKLRASSYSSSNFLSALDFQLLNQIHIRHGQSQLPDCSISLNYSSVGRVHLSTIETRAGKQIGKYQLIYDNYDKIDPDYLTIKRDHWGYNPNNSTCGMLKEIKYPTGGSSMLEYEPHDYSRIMSIDRSSMIDENGTAGGLRIKSITTKDGNTVLQKKTFTYKNPNSQLSSGQLFVKPITKCSWATDQGFVSIKQNIPLIPISSSSGTYVGYSYIAETKADGTVRKYHYSNFGDVMDEPAIYNVLNDTLISPFNKYSDLDFMRGRLLNDTIEDSLGNIWSYREYSYNPNIPAEVYQYSYAANIVSTATLHDAGCIYKIYYPKSDLQRIVTTTKYDNGMVTDTTRYTMTSYNQWMSEWECNPHFRKCTSEETSRKGYSVKKIHSYSYANTDRCFLPRVSSATYINGTLTQTDKVIYQTINNHFQPRHETSAYSTAVDDTLITYSSYSNQGLPLKYQRPGEFPTRLFWSSKGQLLASVTSPYDDLDCDEKVYHIEYSPAGTFTGEEYSPKDVIKKNGRSIFEYPEVRATTYIYDDLGRVHASAEANGICKFFFYDALGRITEIRNDKQQVLQKFTYKYSTGQ